MIYDMRFTTRREKSTRARDAIFPKSKIVNRKS